MFQDTDEIEKRLIEIGTLSDNDVPLVETLLLLGIQDGAAKDYASYAKHIDAMKASLQSYCAANPQTDDVLAYRLDALNDVIRAQYGYDKDVLGFDVVEHIHFPTVIDRRKGIPVALGALYIALAQSQDWSVAGLNFPGHFLLALSEGGRRLIVDPYHDGHAVEAAGMRQLLKENVGAHAELNHAYYDAVSTRDVIVRFYNNRKIRLIENSDYDAALTIAERLLVIAPQEERLLFDAGVLSIKATRLHDATQYLQRFMTVSDDGASIAQARDMLNHIKATLQ